MQHYASKFVPRLLNSDQKEYRIVVCTELKEQAKNDPNFISNIITDDEFGCSGTSLRRSSSRLSGRLPFTTKEQSTTVQSNGKSMLVCFFDNEGTVHKAQTSRQWCNNSCSPYHDNVLVHASLVW